MSTMTQKDILASSAKPETPGCRVYVHYLTSFDSAVILPSVYFAKQLLISSFNRHSCLDPALNAFLVFVDICISKCSDFLRSNGGSIAPIILAVKNQKFFPRNIQFPEIRNQMVIVEIC